MPLFERKCSACGHEFDHFTRDRTAEIRCECGGETTPIFSVPRIIMPFDQGPIGTTKNRPAFKRHGDGVAALTKSGGYRPAVTHMATCPKCARRRNVAVLASFNYGQRVECEACNHQWIHHASTAADAMERGHDSALRPGKMFGKVTTADDALPVRGA